MFTRTRVAVVSVINDLVTDNRVQRTCSVLHASGYKVVLIGRLLPGSLALPDWPYHGIRMRMLFRTGPLFYMFFNTRLFFRLVFTRADLLVANDLDTLGPNYLVSRWKGVPLIYDSHELFCEVPELQSTPFKKRIWERLEKGIVPKLKYCVTVSASIAEFFHRKYGLVFGVVRNIPDPPLDFKPRNRSELQLPEDKKIILLQGAGINIQRGAEELVEAMQYVSDAILLIIGSGDAWQTLEKSVRTLNIRDRVRMIPRMPKSELMHFTHNADLGVSIDKNTNLNYRFSLPNKVFDYLQAGVPVLATRLPEVEKVLTEFNAGVFIDTHEPKHIASVINRFFSEEDAQTKRLHVREAARVLTWDHEKQVLEHLVKAAAGPPAQ